MNPLIGFDIGGTACRIIVGEFTHNGVVVLARDQFPTRETPDPTACVTRLTRRARDLLHGAQPYGAGIACGGPLNPQTGMILNPPNLPGWEHFPICSMVAEELGCFARLENDADACALAEWQWGAGRGCNSMAFLTMGTGLGAGLILDGRLYRGARHGAGELGHWRLATEGPLGYGKAGSFEGFCSGGGIARWAHREGLPYASGRELFNAAAAGHVDAEQLVQHIATRLGEGLALLSDVLDLEKIVIGGIFARQEMALRPLMEHALLREALHPCPVIAATLGESVGDLAALAVALLGPRDPPMPLHSSPPIFEEVIA